MIVFAERMAVFESVMLIDELLKRLLADICFVFATAVELSTTTKVAFAATDVAVGNSDICFDLSAIYYPYSGNTVSSDASEVIDPIATNVSY